MEFAQICHFTFQLASFVFHHGFLKIMGVAVKSIITTLCVFLGEPGWCISENELAPCAKCFSQRFTMLI